ncbi:U6 small nuclear RNA (adenine-(43)-N(6))-methyltransferase, partial [Chrysoperla carnea]|uniref:U6 small nuclear RNA (adenine-(43)-N(6))-methyltransferase n=1 Tax=Chrysoperla carnea TaxID=189513 RepID=UPI001D07A095
MSVNKKMHPRNIFKTPPSFSELGHKYLEFNKYLKIGLDGKLSLNFNDVEALRALSKVLLLHYFGINIEIPKNTLVPTIPLRLNYILWLQDLANFLQIPADENVTLIDVGAGATCVYGLLAAKLRKWKVLALESNTESYLVAKRNVETNSLANYIEVKNNGNDEKNILIGSLHSMENYTFTMCNPPFFKENDESNEKTPKIKAQPPKNAFTGTLNELTYPGGEVAFVEKLIAESQILKEQVMIYTTMIGHKKNLKILREKLKSLNIPSYIQTEFCQGNTTRWALAWTFKNINLQEFHQTTETEINKRTNHTKIQSFSHCFENISCIQDLLHQLERVLKEMKTIYEITYTNENLTEIKVQAIENTWQNARRKRRELARKEQILNQNIETTLKLINNYIETDYIEQIRNIINRFELKIEERTPELNTNTMELKDILN